MKIMQLLAVLLLVTPFSSVYAEATSEEDNVQAYCVEQAELAGIDDRVEKEEYIAECVYSYAISSDDAQPPAE